MLTFIFTPPGCLFDTLAYKFQGIERLFGWLGLLRMCKTFILYLNPIRPWDLDPGIFPGVGGGGHKVPGFNLRVLDCCLTLKLCVCFQKYILTSQEKKISLNLKKSVIFWDLKIFCIWDFVKTWLTKTAVTRSIFEIEGSYFGFFLIFMCLRNHI